MTKHLVFAHANGFPAGTYRLLFEAWRAAGFEVHAPARLGHDPRFPVTSNWPRLREELAAFIETQSATPAYLVGHSLGGLLSLMVASRRPELVRGLVVLDAPLVTGWRAHSLKVVKATGLLKRISHGRVSQRRRHEWPSREAVLAHFASKAVFARWDPRVLADYVASGFDEHEGKVVLGFRREVETRIYNTLPHTLGEQLRRHPLQCPVGFIAGTQSAEAHQFGMAAAHAMARERFVWLEGSHLYPMEKPGTTANEVLRLIGTMP